MDRFRVLPAILLAALVLFALDASVQESSAPAATDTTAADQPRQLEQRGELPPQPGDPGQMPLPPEPGEPFEPPQPLQTIESEESPVWSRTLERIATGVVSIQVDAVRAFDTEWNLSSQATGFVVDAERGLILTNRHVVMAGPVTAQATFLNREEVQLYPVYRDPVHDFGLFRYDPSRLRFIKPAELQLHPQGARVGLEIRVVGNDAGEQLSILSGTLARLDRQAPNYGVGRYNDFNTFYYQAASSTSGGSSGSPVIDIQGRVVALNAGGSSGAASSFYLPLTRVQRALKLIQEGKPVTRGTLQTVFQFAPFDELRRLGLRPETEEQVREAFPKVTGMLVVREVQPGSLTAGVLEPGDILVRAGGKLTVEFDPLSELLDENVGGEVEIEAQRGGQTLRVSLAVQDLHAITPAEFIEFGEAVVHELSYQQARHFNVPIQGVYIANPGFVFGAAGIPRGAVIVGVGGQPVRTLQEFETLLEGLHDGARVTIRYFTMDDPGSRQWRVVTVDREWFPARKCRRDDELGYWPCTELAAGPAAPPIEPATTRFVRTGDAIVDRLAPSLVRVEFNMPYSVSGVTDRHYFGTGLIIDAKAGLVVTDRNTVPVAMGEVRLTFSGAIEVPGEVRYIHPLHNLAVVSYDPAHIGDTPVQSARLDPTPLKSGERVWVVGLREDQQIASQATEVSSIEAVSFPLSRTLQFRDSNLETITLVNPPTYYDGVVVNRNGRVAALWSSFAFQRGRNVEQTNLGIAAELVEEVATLAAGNRPLHSLEVEFQELPIAGARKLGLTDEWIAKLEAHSSDRRQVLAVGRLVAGSPAAEVLQTGDVLLAIDGRPVNRFREVERAVQKGSVDLTIWRDGALLDVTVHTVPLFGSDIDRVLIWAGATLQAPHRALAAQRGIPPEGVFVAYFYYGSPATRYGLYAGRRIMEVDGRPTPDLDAFIAAVAGRPDRSSVRLKTITWNNAVEVITLKLDNHYWPAYQLRRTESGWVREAVE